MSATALMLSSIACLLTGATVLASPSVTLLDSRATYLHTAAADSPPGSVAIQLSSYGIAGGDRIQIQRVGEFNNGPNGDQFTSMIGVFSSNATLLAGSNLHRVPGAIAAGVPIPTGGTFYGNERTDIPEDFAVSSGLYPSGTICILVPTGASHLFLAAADSLYSDNNDPNNNFGFELTLLASCAADFDHSGAVDGADLGALLGNWGTQSQIGIAGDLNCDGMVDGADLGTLLGYWGPCS